LPALSRNVRTEYRWSGDDAERLRKYAGELVALAPDLILATGSPSVMQLLDLTRTLPIVFLQVADPVGAGYGRKPRANGLQCDRFLGLRICH
jgi:putative ABC transport system substrate-binding protein